MVCEGIGVTVRCFRVDGDGATVGVGLHFGYQVCFGWFAEPIPAEDSAESGTWRVDVLGCGDGSEPLVLRVEEIPYCNGKAGGMGGYEPVLHVDDDESRAGRNG